MRYARYALLLALALLGAPLYGQKTLEVGFAAGQGLVIAQQGKGDIIVVVAPEAGQKLTETPAGKKPVTKVLRAVEKQAASDLAKYLELMTGVKPQVADTAEAIAAAAQHAGPVFVVGEQALIEEPSLRQALAGVAKKEPYLRADAIALRLKGNRVYLAGNNEQSHYYAVSQLLQAWGCRWYLPTDIGECIPQHPVLTIKALDFAYAPPFEVRGYWISWLGDNNGAAEFQLRNMMNKDGVPSGHSLSSFTKSLAKEGQSHWQVPIAEDATAAHVAAQVETQFAAGTRFSLGMEDGTYRSESPVDKALNGNIHDKYFLVSSLTDPFIVFYNKVCRILLDKYPDSKAKIGFLAYVNLTLPPQREIFAEKPLVAYLAPIDIDPIHGMDDPRSPPRQEYKDIMYRWAEVMQGRVVIYDYDQGMLVWRDLPNPAIQSIRQDIKHYRDAGILGISTESRNAIATVFLNLHVRGQLMWNPDLDVDALLAEFYPKFYGPVAEPMARYWGAIFQAWNETLVTEHEFFVAPAIYTPALVAQLKQELLAAEAIVAERFGQRQDLSRHEQQVVERMKFTRLSFNMIEYYMGMVFAGARDGDYAAAVAAGEQALATRETLTDMNGTFATYRKYGNRGSPWLPGEVAQYRDLLAFTDGSKGTLIAKLPLEWAFRRDPNDTGMARGYARKPADLAYWQAKGASYTVATRKDYPTTEWELIRTDLYPQAQGVLHPDWQAYTGYMWSKTTVDLKAADLADKVHLRFPGLFSESWLYVNGLLVAHRPQNHMWWHNNYKFEWDVELTGKLKPGANDITLRTHCTHHIGGLFRRPFLYRPVPVPAAEAPATPAAPAP